MHVPRPHLKMSQGEPPRQTSSRNVEISNALGLDFRAAERVASLAQCFFADVRIAMDGRRVDGRSVLGLLTLAAPCGARLELEAEGPEAEAVVEALAGLIGRGFDELDG